MDNTIIKVINKMILNSGAIGNVYPAPGNSSNEFFFVFNMKHFWSILLTGLRDDFLLFYYKDNPSFKDLVEDKDRFSNAICYSTMDFKSKEATESFRDLFNIVKGKTYGMEEVFKDILNS